MTIRRLLGAIGVAMLGTVATAAPVSAHNVTGVEPSDYAGRIVSVTPRVQGLKVRLLDLGQRVEIGNDTTANVVVLRADGTPGRRIAPSSSARFRDDRTVYSGPKPSGGKQVLGTWTIELRHRDRPVAVTGLVTYVPGPSAWPWVGLILVLIAVTTAAAWSRRWGRWLSIALAVLVASDVIHSFGTAAATRASVLDQVTRVLLAGLVTVAAWVVGVASIPSLQRNHEGGLVAGAAVGLVIAVFSGVADIGAFANSQLLSAFPADVARVAVALAFGLGIGLVTATIAVIARDPALRPTTLAHNARSGP